MKLRLKAFEEGNWSLIFFASIGIIVGVILVVISILYWRQLGWWALALSIGGTTSICFNYLGIRDNKHEWVLLDLILPN